MKFEVGKKYYSRRLCDASFTYYIVPTRRTEKTLYFEFDERPVSCRIKIDEMTKDEFIVFYDIVFRANRFKNEAPLPKELLDSDTFKQMVEFVKDEYDTSSMAESDIQIMAINLYRKLYLVQEI